MTPEERDRWEAVIHTALYHPTKYVRGSVKANLCGMLTLLIQLQREGTITEGQASRAAGLDRVTIRELADRMNESADLCSSIHVNRRSSLRK